MIRTGRSLLFTALAIALGTAAPAALAIDEYLYPSLAHAQQQLDGTAQTLNGDQRMESDYGGHRARALELIRQARFELDQAAQYADNANPPPPPAQASDANIYADEPYYDDPPPQYIPPPEPVVYVMPAPPSSPVGYWGHHPIPGGGWCLAEGPHLHNYEPQFYDQFRLVEGYFKFGEGFNEWVYAGPHPISGGGWCNIQEPHRHNYRPEVGFIYDPARRGYYYDRERAVVIRTEVVHPPPSYRPPQEVVGRFNHPPVLQRAPLGTPRQRVWEHEHVIMQPHPAGRPPQAQPVGAFHPGPQPNNNFHPTAQPMMHEQPIHPAAQNPQPANHESFNREPQMNHEAPAPMAHPQPMVHAPPPKPALAPAAKPVPPQKPQPKKDKKDEK